MKQIRCQCVRAAKGAEKAVKMTIYSENGADEIVYFNGGLY